MLSERERNALEQIERDLSADTGFAAAMAGSRRHREQRWRPTWTVGLFVTGLMVTILCAVLGSAVGAAVGVATCGAALGLSCALASGRSAAGPGVRRRSRRA